MNYVLTGAAGNITRQLAKQLAASGEAVTVIGRNEAHLQELIPLGIQPAIGSLEDVDFLKRTFDGADAIYTMIPLIRFPMTKWAFTNNSVSTMPWLLKMPV